MSDEVSREPSGHSSSSSARPNGSTADACGARAESEGVGAPRAEVDRTTAAILATGDELVEGRHTDTNSGFLAAALLELGIETREFVVLGDDEARLSAELVRLAAEHAFVILTGGLGPTLDDVTRNACARAAGVELELDAAAREELARLFASRNRPFSASNERQALFPRGALMLANPNGTAPGFALTIGRARVFALPGPPREMKPMLAEHVLPEVRATLASRSVRSARAVLFLFGIPESAFADRVGARMARGANPIVGVTASGAVLSVTVRAYAATSAEAEERAVAARAEILALCPENVFSTERPELEHALARELFARALRITTAESCTGGLVAEKLTRVPGISAAFESGYVTYSNEAKTRLLGVDPALLARHGAVSSEAASAMARGALERSGADIAVSVTGIAGPDGGTPEKPVGFVWFGIATPRGVETHERRFLALGRDLVREFSAHTALDLARRRVIAEWDSDRLRNG